MSETFNILPTCLQFLLAMFIQNAFSVDCARLNDGIEMGEHKFDSVALCIAKISKSELFSKPTVVLKIGLNETKNEHDFIDDVLVQLTDNIIPHFAIDADDNATIEVSHGSYLFANYFEDCEAMTAFNFDDLDKNVKYLIILDRYSDVCVKHFKDIGNVIGKYDISLFSKNSETVYNLYTFIPDVDAETCNVINGKLIKINTCLGGDVLLYHSFPRKETTNLKKCPLKVGMGSLFPFAIIENKKSYKTYDPISSEKIRGSDVELIKIMAENFNATLQLFYIYIEEENPFIDISFMAFIMNGSLEVCAGGLYRIYGHVVAYSGNYMGQTIMWIYSAEREIKTLNNMVMNIDGLYWFFIFYFTYSIVWYLICLFDKNAVSLTKTLTYSLGALLGSTSLQDAKSFKQKILNFVYLNMCLHLSVYISIELYSFLTIRGPPEMFKTNNDIMQSGRTPYLLTIAKYFVKDEKYERFANTSTECSGFGDCAEKSLKNKGVTVYIQSYFYPFQAATAVNDEARMLRPVESLLTVFNEMIIRKESPLVLKFQRIIQRLFEAGICERLFKEAIGLNVVAKAKFATENIITSSYACQAGCQISLVQIAGVFVVWGIGCVASTCVFILEILTKKGVFSI